MNRIHVLPGFAYSNKLSLALHRAFLGILQWCDNVEERQVGIRDPAIQMQILPNSWSYHGQ